MTISARQKIKLQISFKEFEQNIQHMWKEQQAELDKILIAGAAVYAASAAQHTPPNLGKRQISPMYYVNGIWYKDDDRAPLKGRRPVYDLISLVRHSDSRYKSYYGKLLREGYLYMVKIMRPKLPVITKYCKTLTEAEKYAEITFRGLTRAAWGLRFAQLSGKMPPAFQKYISHRPKLQSLSALNVVKLDRKTKTVTLTNMVASGGYVASMDINASIAALKTMSERIKKFLKKKYNL